MRQTLFTLCAAVLIALLWAIAATAGLVIGTALIDWTSGGAVLRRFLSQPSPVGVLALTTYFAGALAVALPVQLIRRLW